NLEATLQPPLCLRKDREIIQVLDLMVTVKLLQEKAQAWGEPLGEGSRSEEPLAIIGNTLLQHAAQLAKHIVPLEPELRHLTEVGVALPYLPRIFLHEKTQIVRQPLPAGYQ